MNRELINQLLNEKINVNTSKNGELSYTEFMNKISEVNLEIAKLGGGYLFKCNSCKYGESVYIGSYEMMYERYLKGCPLCKDKTLELKQGKL